jgi:murein DD-endopeptidase MepM/ murein hydrolase activator NlpD
MRRVPLLLCALILLALPATAAADGSGGATAPSTSGGVTPGQPLDAVPRFHDRPEPPVARVFKVVPRILVAGKPATFEFRVDGEMPRVRVRIELRRSGSAFKRLRLGSRRTGRRYDYVWTPKAGELAAGEYAVTLRAEGGGRSLRRTARASGRSRLTVEVPPPPPPPPPSATGVFPVAGEYSFGGDDARFGAARDGHVHQGQDIIAASGTPIVAPLAATVTWIRYQEGGAGHYVVTRAADGRDFVFMHIRTGTITVAEGDTLVAGQQFAEVGSTGASSGPHLHFEIWPDGWYSSKTSAPIDPLPQLLAWAGSR